MDKLAWIMIAVGVALMTYAWRHRRDVSLRPADFVPPPWSRLEAEAGPFVPMRIKPVVDMSGLPRFALSNAEVIETGLSNDVAAPNTTVLPNPWKDLTDYIVPQRRTWPRWHLPAIVAAAMLALAGPLLPPPARADDAQKITVREALSLAAALRNLDGHIVVIKQNGADQTVMTPWEFGSGSLRLKIANDLAILSAVEQSLDKVRQEIIREVQKSRGVTEIKPGTPEYDDFAKQYGDAVDQPAAGTQDIARIKASELKLDKNEISVTVLQAMRPILDFDK